MNSSLRLERATLASLASLLLVAGCRDATAPLLLDGPVIEARTVSVVPGEPVSIRIENPTAHQWGFNLCSNARVQRSEGGAWVTLPSLAICTMEIQLLLPGQQLDAQVPIPMGATTGVYRVLIEFSRDGTSARPVSNSFAVK